MANILLNIDIIGTKKINIIISRREAYISTYNMRIPIDIKP